MNGADPIINIIADIVSQMTPTITITDNVVESGNYKLSMCNTYWIRKRMILTIGGENYKVVDFVQNQYIIVSGASQPVATTFVLEAPGFEHGSHRKVDKERTKKKLKNSPFVYLPVPEVAEQHDPDSDLAYVASIRPIFLMGYDKGRDTIDLQQVEIIDPVHAMADLFIYIIKEDSINFDELTTVIRKEWMNFGNNQVWGNDELIFDEPLSGVELRFDLPVMYGAPCLCDTKTIVTCLPVTITKNNVFETEVPSGGTFNYDTNGTPDVYYNRPYITAQVSYNNYDAAWRRLNGGNDFNDAIPDSATIQQVKPDFANGRFDYLKYFNLWAHKFRFTGINGGYFDEADGLYYDKDGNLSDLATEFPIVSGNLAWIYDHLTGYRMLRGRQGGVDWFAAMSSAGTYSFDGISVGWFNPTAQEALQLNTVGTDALSIFSGNTQRPFFDMSQTYQWVSNVRLDNTTQSWRCQTNAAASIGTITNTIANGNRWHWLIFDSAIIPQP